MARSPAKDNAGSRAAEECTSLRGESRRLAQSKSPKMAATATSLANRAHPAVYRHIFPESATAELISLGLYRMDGRIASWVRVRRPPHWPHALRYLPVHVTSQSELHSRQQGAELQ